MNEKIISAITQQMQALIEKHGFTAVENDCYKNEKLAFKIRHSEEEKMLYLDIADLNETGEPKEFTVASSWLFEDPKNIRDAESAGMDFLDTLKGKMGIRGVRTQRGGEVILPDKKSGDSKNIDALCGTLLAIFPQHKDDYKAHVSTYGSLLYIDFFKNTFTKRIIELLDQNNKKAIKKLFSALSDMYCNGDRTTQNAIAGILLGGAVKESPTRYDRAIEYLADYGFLKTALMNINPKVNSDKRFKSILE